MTGCASGSDQGGKLDTETAKTWKYITLPIAYPNKKLTFYVACLSNDSVGGFKCAIAGGGDGDKTGINVVCEAAGKGLAWLVFGY